eukprot:s421_g25.t2
MAQAAAGTGTELAVVDTPAALAVPDHPASSGHDEGPEDRLQRLDATMTQTNHWARLRAILQDSTPFVCNTICTALDEEMGRSFRNIVGQLQAIRDIQAQMQKVLDSEEAAALEHLMRDIHPSSLRALQRQADGINEDIAALRLAVETGDIEGLQSRANRMANKAKRFRNKFEEIRPKLDKLRRELQKICAKCADGAQKADELMAETERRREWWGTLLLVVNGLMLCGGVLLCGGTVGMAVSMAVGAGSATEMLGSLGVSMGLRATRATPVRIAQALGQAAADAASQAAAAASQASDSVASVKGAMASLPTQLSTATPFFFGGFLLVALALLGYAGRDLVKKLLGQLWAAEIEEHKKTKDAFQHMEQVVWAAVGKLQGSCEKNDALERCLDMVVEVSEELAASAEDGLHSGPEELESNMASWHQQVEDVCAACEKVPQVDTGAEAQGQESPFNIEVGNDAEVDGGWILIQSSSLSPLDCLPPNTYFLVPVAEVARLGALLAAGPNGNNLIQVCAQGAAARLMRKFRVRGSSVLHNFTANHPLRVMRSGNWIQEHASTLQVGDVLDTVSGLQEIESTSAPEMSSEEVFSLDVQDGGEAYVFTPTQNADGQLSWSGVAVLGSMKETQERSRSAPPQLRSEMPSKGSWQCKDRERCSNICRKFLKGKCSEGSHCRFCHRPHPEESTRQPRGPRETGSSGSLLRCFPTFFDPTGAFA